jgi:hypothetical protein
MTSYRQFDVTDFTQREALMERLDADQAETSADIERRRLARLTEPSVFPQPEPAPARQQTHTAEWAAHCRAYSDACAAGLERKLRARQDHIFDNLLDALGQVIAREREQHRDELTRLRAEYDAKLQGLLTGLRMAQPEAAARACPS